ncbi:hypothetical protein [Alkaliphilus crotonatoxidans]
MGRVEAKKQIKKRRQRVYLTITLIMLILIVGLVAVDEAHREMMARYDAVGVLGYYREGPYHVFQLIGQEYYIDQEMVMETVETFTVKWKERIMTMVERLKDKISTNG